MLNCAVKFNFETANIHQSSPKLFNFGQGHCLDRIPT